MAEPEFDINIDVRGMPKSRAYALLNEQLEHLLRGDPDAVEVMATFACVIHLGLGLRSTGFYRVSTPERLLKIGPYQGTLVPRRVAWGEGACGMAAEQFRSVILPVTSPRTGAEMAIPVINSAQQMTVVFWIQSNLHEARTFDRDDVSFFEGWLRRFLGAKQSASWE